MNTPIDPLGDFRADGYGLDDERRARLRSRVLDAIPDDLPAGVTTLVTPRQATAEHDEHDELEELQVLEPLPTGDRGRPSGPRRERRSTNGHRLLVAAAVAVALGLLAVVVGTTRSSDRQVGTLNDSSKVSLEDLVAVVSNEPDRQLAPGEYQQFERTEGTRRVDGSFDITVDRNWHTIDSTGARETTTKLRPPGALNGAETDIRFLGRVPDPPCLDCFGPFDYDGMRNAPQDPTELLDLAREAMPGQADWGVAEQLAVLEGLTTTPPAVRAAALRALGLMGFRAIGEVPGPVGITGVGFSLDTPDGPEVIVFDPATARILGYWQTPPSSHTGWEAATHWASFSDIAVTPPPA